MQPIKSKRHKLNLQVHTGIGAGPADETDLAAHSSPLSDEDLSEIAAYGATRSCANPTASVHGVHAFPTALPKGPFNPAGPG